MGDRPRVSIGLPVYNGERYLEQALNSILGQTYTDFELIISDNASSDRTKAICEEFRSKDQRIRYYRNEVNLGAGPNHDLVFRRSKGKYFKWFGYDDLIAPNFLSRCIEILDRYHTVVLCTPKTKIIDEYVSIHDAVKKYLKEVDSNWMMEDEDEDTNEPDLPRTNSMSPVRKRLLGKQNSNSPLRLRNNSRMDTKKGLNDSLSLSKEQIST